jgi:hypothetical protein
MFWGLQFFSARVCHLKARTAFILDARQFIILEVLWNVSYKSIFQTILALKSLFNASKNWVFICWEWEPFLIRVAKIKGVKNYDTWNLSEGTLIGFNALSLWLCANSDSTLTKLLTQNAQNLLHICLLHKIGASRLRTKILKIICQGNKFLFTFFTCRQWQHLILRLFIAYNV